MDITITSDNIVNLFWLLIGIGLTLLGVVFTEWLKERKLKQRLINALFEEIRANIKIAHCNKNLSLSTKDYKTPFYAFHSIAYEQYKLTLMIDERQIPNLSDYLVSAYSIVEIANRKILEFEKKRKAQDEQLMFERIEELMNEVYKKLKPYIKEERLKIRS